MKRLGRASKGTVAVQVVLSGAMEMQPVQFYTLLTRDRAYLGSQDKGSWLCETARSKDVEACVAQHLLLCSIHEIRCCVAAEDRSFLLGSCDLIQASRVQHLRAREVETVFHCATQHLA